MNATLFSQRAGQNENLYGVIGKLLIGVKRSGESVLYIVQLRSHSFRSGGIIKAIILSCLLQNLHQDETLALLL